MPVVSRRGSRSSSAGERLSISKVLVDKVGSREGKGNVSSTVILRFILSDKRCESSHTR